MKSFLAISALVSLVAGLPFTPRQLSSRQYEGTSVPSNITRKLATGWYPGWNSNRFPPSKIAWDQYDSLTYAFALTTQDDSFFSFTETDVLVDFIAKAHEHGVKALVSVGGWTGSQYFSSAVGSPENRTAFADSLSNFSNKYGIDGLDFDWEYPNGDTGLSCNQRSPNDTENFYKFMRELRDKCRPDFRLTAAVAVHPFSDETGSPSQNVSRFADVFNHIAIMAYDLNGNFNDKGAGPNAPLDDSCAPAPNQRGSVTDAVKEWTQAGFPAEKLLLGVASYGHSYIVEENVIHDDATMLAQYPEFSHDITPLGTNETPLSTTQECGQVISKPSGVFDYSDLIARGFIDSQGTPSNAAGILHHFDECSQTPWLYNTTSHVLISYDDPKSFHAKGNFIREQGLGGFAMWHVASDSEDGALAKKIVTTMNQ